MLVGAAIMGTCVLGEVEIGNAALIDDGIDDEGDLRDVVVIDAFAGHVLAPEGSPEHTQILRDAVRQHLGLLRGLRVSLTLVASHYRKSLSRRRLSSVSRDA